MTTETLTGMQQRQEVAMKELRNRPEFYNASYTSSYNFDVSIAAALSSIPELIKEVKRLNGLLAEKS